MTIRIGINGLGRIGRTVLRLALEDPRIEVAAVNDLAEPATLAYLLNHDTVHGQPKNSFVEKNGTLCSENWVAPITAEKEPSLIPWQQNGVAIVLDCTGVFKTASALAPHIKAGAHAVLLSAPAKDDLPTFVMGVNADFVAQEHTIVSNASCTTNALAPVMALLDANFEVQSALMTTIHAATASQAVVDGPSKNLRLGRSVFNNIIPTTTGAAAAVGRVLPQLNGKITGMAFRVPTPNVSVVDVTVHTKTPLTQQQLYDACRAWSLRYPSIVKLAHAHAVSTDFIGEKASAVIDMASTLVCGDLTKMVIWYDNEVGYSARMLDLACVVAKKQGLK